MLAKTVGRQRAAVQAAAAADVLDRFLQARGNSVTTKAAVSDSALAVSADPPTKPLETFGRSASSPPGPTGDGVPLRLAHTDWLFHQLAIVGPVEVLDAFQVAATGAGTVPWVVNFDLLEEDWFHRLMAPADRTLSLTGVRVLTGQLRQAAEHRHALAIARVGRSRACPFDLHSLVPVPPEILARGPDHPDSLAWLWEHWGTTEPLRQVAIVDAVGHRSTSAPSQAVSFWSADWSPWRATERMQRDWPALRFVLQPRYDSAA